jgi:hypothetical protein
MFNDVAAAVADAMHVHILVYMKGSRMLQLDDRCCRLSCVQKLAGMYIHSSRRHGAVSVEYV